MSRSMLGRALLLAAALAALFCQYLRCVHANSIVSVIGGIAQPAKPGFTRIEGAMIPRWCEASITRLPKSEAEVSAIIKELRSDCASQGGGKGLSIRAFRTLYHSASDMPCPDLNAACSAVLDMGAMNKVVHLDRAAQTVTVGPGTCFNDLMLWLEPLDLTLTYYVLPMYRNLTVAGMLLTGAHGSSRKFPSAFGTSVKAAKWVDAYGKVHTTTDARKLTGTLGAFGVVTEVTVQVKPLTKLTMLTWRLPHDALLFPLVPKLLKDDNLAIIRWLPDVHQVFITTRHDVPTSRSGDAEWSAFSSNPLISAGGGPAVGIQQIDALFGNKMGLLDDIPLCLAETVSMTLSAEHGIPTPDGHPATGRMQKLVAGECEPGPDIGCLWRTLPVNLLELDFAESDLLDWMHDLRRIFAREVHGCIPSVIGFAIRFGKASDHPLDMQYGRDSVNVDIVSNKGPFLDHAPSAYQHVFDEIEQMTLCKYQARPHWGKNSNRAFTNPNLGCRIRDKYPEFDKYVAQVRAADPERVFESPVFAEMLGDRPVPRSPGCAVRAQCYCQSDEDCGFHHKCVPGGTFPEYNVCKQALAVVEDKLVSKLFDWKSWGKK